MDESDDQEINESYTFKQFFGLILWIILAGFFIYGLTKIF